MAWRNSPILVPLIDEVKAKNPGMTVYTIGDAAHQAEPSDHNPDEWDFVCAADFMIGGSFTAADAEYLFDRITAIIRGTDARPAYVIYNRRIVSNTISPGVIRGYGGTDPHTNHVHVSVVHGSNPHPTDSWGIYPAPPTEGGTVATSVQVSGFDTAAETELKVQATNGTLGYNAGGLPTEGDPAFIAATNGKAANVVNYLEQMFNQVAEIHATITAAEPTS